MNHRSLVLLSRRLIYDPVTLILSSKVFLFCRTTLQDFVQFKAIVF